jgi:hypothetical protein
MENFDVLRWAVLAGVAPDTIRRYLAGKKVQVANRRRIEAAKSRLDEEDQTRIGRT